MNLSFAKVVFALACILPAVTRATTDRGGADEAKALVAKAADHFKQVGRDTAFHDFADRTGGYIDRDLYVYCTQGLEGKIVFHATTPALVGRDSVGLKDLDGKTFGLDLAAQTMSQGEGEVDYKWVDPITKKIIPKHTFARKVSDNELCAVGYYK